MAHEALYEAIESAFRELAAADGRLEAEHAASVANLIDRCEIAVMDEEAETGAWEQRELGLARAAHAAGWLRLALTAAGKALEINELPQDQYAYGFNYSAHQIEKNTIKSGND